MTSYERLKRSVWKTEDLTRHMEIRPITGPSLTVVSLLIVTLLKEGARTTEDVERNQKRCSGKFESGFGATG